MTDKQKYEIYRQMFDRAQEIEGQIEGHLIHKYSMVYEVFVSVGDEEKNLYFIDVEAGGSKKTYFHFRGMLTEEQIKEKFF